jgi:anti-sigma factor RsiW
MKTGGSNGPLPIGEDDLQAYADNRLAGDRLEAVEQFLQARPDVAAGLERERALTAELRKRLNFKADEPIPARLRISSIKAGIRHRRLLRRRGAVAALAIFVVGGAGGWTAKDMLTTLPVPPARSVRMVDDAIAAYRTYVVEVAHPVEVKADEEAHLVQWLSKRLRSNIAAPDLSAFGYRLMGGRLLPGATSPAAMLMYDSDSGLRLTLYVKTNETEDTAFQFIEEDGVSAFLWRDRPMGYVVSAPGTREGLLPIARAIYAQMQAGHVN